MLNSSFGHQSGSIINGIMILIDDKWTAMDGDIHSANNRFRNYLSHSVPTSFLIFLYSADEYSWTRWWLRNSGATVVKQIH